MSIILSILRLLLAFAVMTLSDGGGAIPSVPVLTIDLREGDRSIFDAELPLAWGVRSGVEGVNATDFSVATVATQTRIESGPAVNVWMRIRRGQGARQWTVLVPRLTIGCSGTAQVTLDRPDTVAGPLHLTLTLDPAAIDPACTRR